MECMKDGPNCSKCVLLAKAAFETVYRQAHPSMNHEAVKAVIENAKIEGPVQEEGGITALTCEQRQHRARVIGTYMGHTYGKEDT